MTRRPRPWLLPVACAIIGVLWVLWLARGIEPLAPPERAPPSQAAPAPQGLSGGRPTVDPGNSHSQARGTTVPPSGARVTEKPPPSPQQPVQLVFQIPASARVGEGFDARVSIAARQAIGRIVVEVAYDPSRLKARTLEEIDYGARAAGERAFSMNPLNDGSVELVLTKERSVNALVLPLSAPLVQFEALSPGWTQIRIENISVSDASGRALSWSASDQESWISIN